MIIILMQNGNSVFFAEQSVYPLFMPATSVLFVASGVFVSARSIQPPPIDLYTPTTDVRDEARNWASVSWRGKRDWSA